MKITDVKTFCVFANFRNWVFIKVYTDEGISGVGEATVEWESSAVMGAAEDIKQWFIGKDPRDIEGITYWAHRNGYYENNPVLLSALGGYETALWDILGKSLQAPVWRLLGGKYRERVPVYGNGWFRGAETPEEYGAAARKAAEEGWLALKWDPFGAAERTMSRKQLQEAEAQVAAVRQSVGPETQLLIEGHGRFDVATAIEVAHMLESYDVHYFEEPVISDNIAGLAEVRRKSNIPIAAGERLHTLRAFKDLFIAGGVDVVQPDLIHVGGISAVRKIAALAESFGVRISLHNCNGPICTAATLHTDLTLPNLDLQEVMLADAPWRQLVTDEKLLLRNGFYLEVSDKPGIGVELCEECVEDYPPQEIPTFIYEMDFNRDRSLQREGTVQQES